MEQAEVNEQVIRFLMGQKRHTYSKWKDKYQELLDICIAKLPTLDKRTSMQEVMDFAASRGFSLDPQALRCRGIRADQGSSPRGCELAGEW